MGRVVAADIIHAPPRRVVRIIGIGDALVDGRILGLAVRCPVLDVVEVVHADRGLPHAVAAERRVENHLVVRPVQVGAEIPAVVRRFVILADHEEYLAAGVGQRHQGVEVGHIPAAMRVDQADHAFVPPRLIGAGAGVLVFHVHEHRLARMFVEESHETVEQVRKHEGRKLLAAGAARGVAAQRRVAQRGYAMMDREVARRGARRGGAQVEHANPGRKLLFDG